MLHTLFCITFPLLFLACASLIISWRKKNFASWDKLHKWVIEVHTLSTLQNRHWERSSTYWSYLDAKPQAKQFLAGSSGGECLHTTLWASTLKVFFTKWVIIFVPKSLRREKEKITGASSDIMGDRMKVKWQCLFLSLKQSICHFVNIPVCPAPRELWRQQWLKAAPTGENACYTDLKSVIQNLCCWMVYTLIWGTICVDVGTVHAQSQERHPGLIVSVTGNKRWRSTANPSCLKKIFEWSLWPKR